MHVFVCQIFCLLDMQKMFTLKFYSNFYSLFIFVLFSSFGSRQVLPPQIGCCQLWTDGEDERERQRKCADWKCWWKWPTYCYGLCTIMRLHTYHISYKLFIDLINRRALSKVSINNGVCHISSNRNRDY